MPLIRRFSLTILSLLASLWAGVLVVFGCLLFAQGMPDWLTTSTGIQPTAWRLLGASIILGGQFVFMFMVADRIFPRASRRPVTWICELAVALVGLAVLAAAVIAGAIQGSA